MKTFKLLLVALAVTVSTNSFANSNPRFFNEGAISSEIAKILVERTDDLQKDFRVTLFFSISEDRKIQNVSVASPNEELNQFIENSLRDKELSGDVWRMGKVYELSVVQKASV